MGDYEQSRTVDAPADELFEYLADVRNLPTYFSAMTSAEPTDGDGNSTSTVTVTLHSNAGDGQRINQGLDDTLAEIARLVEAGPAPSTASV